MQLWNVIQLLEGVVNNGPDNPAVKAGDEQITYAALDKRANQIAAMLSVIAGEGAVVATIMPSSISLVCNLIGIFKSGNIYLPIDTRFPDNRVGHIFADCSPSVIITTPGSLERVSGIVNRLSLKVEYIITEDVRPSIFRYSPEGYQLFEMPVLSPGKPSGILSGDAGCYIFYTSGTTGTGKPILGCHKGLAHFIHWEKKELGVQPAWRTSQLSQITFDASLRDIFLPLCTGGTLCIPPQDLKSNIPRLVEWLNIHQVNIIHCVPSVFRLLSRELRMSGLQLPALRFLLMAGEPLYGADIREWRNVAGNHTQLINLYGTSETTMAKTFYRIMQAPKDPGQRIPAGKAISNTVVAVINDGHICKAGETGIIYIKTPFWTKGYYRQQEQTDKVFVQNPLVRDRVDIVYRTGDLGRYVEDRNIEVLGRADDQVKVNGTRLHLGEIEEVAMKLPGIQGATVILKEINAEAQLVCYFVSAIVSTAALYAHLQKELAPSAVPAFIVQLSEFPLAVNGKVDKQALKDPELAAIAEWGSMPVIGPVEQKLEVIWRELLGCGTIGRDTPFFRIGGTSLKGIQMISRIHKVFEVTLSIADLFAYPTIEGLGNLIDQYTAAKDNRDIPALPEMEHYALSHAQKRLWIMNELEPGSAAFNMAFGVTIDGEINRAALQQALYALVSRHESMRTSFKLSAGAPRQYINKVAPDDLTLDYMDLRMTEDKPALAGRIAEDLANTRFALSAGSLFRCMLLHMEDEQYVLLIVIHHIVSDGWSMHVIFNDLIHLYRAQLGEGMPTLPDLPVQYKDFASWQNEQLNEADIAGHRGYWMSQFSGQIPVLELPLDFSRRANPGRLGRKHHAIWEGQLVQDINVLLSKYEVTPFVFFLALVQALLYKYSGQTDIVTGTAVNNRDQLQLEGICGLFVNILPLRIATRPSIPFATFLGEVKMQVLETFRHSIYPFDRIIEDLNIAQDRDRAPLFDVMVQMQERQFMEVAGVQEPQPVEMTEYVLSRNTSKYDLTFNFAVSPAAVAVTLEFNTLLFKVQTIEKMNRDLLVITQKVLSDPHVSLLGIKEHFVSLDPDRYAPALQLINEQIQEDF